MSDLRVVSSEAAPKAIGPYSQAVVAAPFVFCSGQIALDAATGVVIEGDVRAQTRKVLDNLAAVLAAAGTSLDQVVKTNVYLLDMGEFPAFNEEYAKYFTGTLPARATVQVSRLPRDVRVEIDCVAVLP